MNKDEINSSEEELTVTLTLDDDSELECQVIQVFEANDKQYIALLPLEGPEAEDGNVFLYRFIDNGTDDPELENITDDAEYELASDAWDEYLDSIEFDELVTEDPEEN